MSEDARSEVGGSEDGGRLFPRITEEALDGLRQRIGVTFSGRRHFRSDVFELLLVNEGLLSH